MPRDRGVREGWVGEIPEGPILPSIAPRVGWIAPRVGGEICHKKNETSCTFCFVREMPQTYHKNIKCDLQKTMHK